MPTCPVCKKPVTDGEAYRKKMYHPSCLELKRQEALKKREQKLKGDPEEQLLVDYILDLFGLSELPSRLAAQIAGFKKQGISCKEMRLALHWYYKIENHFVDLDEDAEPTIGIVPYALKESEAFWEHMKAIEEANKSFVPNSQTIVVRPRKHYSPFYSKTSPYDIGAMEPEGADTHP